VEYGADFISRLENVLQRNFDEILLRNLQFIDQNALPICLSLTTTYFDLRLPDKNRYEIRPALWRPIYLVTAQPGWSAG
ncbi:MAG: hypothetical protein LC749_16290, partial [Actinobacteria bacterium]|nr:hypothetical protein [Actinomycetota bacterium]